MQLLTVKLKLAYIIKLLKKKKIRTIIKIAVRISSNKKILKINL